MDDRGSGYDLGVLSPMVKRPGHETDSSPHLVLRLRMRAIIPPLPQYVFMAWCLIKQWIVYSAWYLVKHRDNFTLPSRMPVPPSTLD